MNRVYIGGTVNDDGSLTIPAFAVRGLGYEPEDEINLTMPVQQCICDCEESELFLSRCCGEAECSGYTSDDDELNIPANLLCEAALPAGIDISVLAADGVLLIVAAKDELEDLPQELQCFLHELGVYPVSMNGNS